MAYPLSFKKELKKNSFPGKYFAIEGIDGSGKSTQLESVKKYLEKVGKKVILTSEPMATGMVQEIIRGALFSKFKLTPRAYQFLYSADRAINHATVVEPALQEETSCCLTGAIGRQFRTALSIWEKNILSVKKRGRLRLQMAFCPAITRF